MCMEVVSDIHGNLPGFEAVLADLRQTAPDLIFHGGDLAHAGASPAEIVDRIRDLAWPGVLGNTDEMLFAPESLEEFAKQAPKLQPLCAALRDMACATCEMLREERLSWLRYLPRNQIRSGLAFVPASPDNLWRAPTPDSTAADVEAEY